MLFCNLSRDVILILLKQLLVLEHEPDTLWNGHALPLFERVLCIGDNPVKFVLGGLRDLPNQLAGINWVINFDHLGALGLHPLTIYEIFVDFGKGAVR